MMPVEFGPVPPTALITGGAGALGFAIAERLTADGRRVAIVDKGPAVAERARALDGAVGLSCDLSKRAQLRGAFQAASEELGTIGIVVHCAGIAPLSPFLDTDCELFEHALGVNLLAGFSFYKLAARQLVAAGCGGRMLAITSISGARAGFGRTAYGTSKAALGHLVAQMALELGPYGITANAIAPGPVDTPLSRGAHTAEARADYLRTIPQGRYGTEAEIAAAAAFLTGEEAGYVNGQTLFVDGGYMASGMGVSMAQSVAAVRRRPRGEEVHAAPSKDPAREV